MTKDRIVFFANGDFAIDTFETLVNNGSNIVGLVTCANDKVRFHKKTIKQVAEELTVPYYMIKGEKFEEDAFFIDWLKRIIVPEGEVKRPPTMFGEPHVLKSIRLDQEALDIEDLPSQE